MSEQGKSKREPIARKMLEQQLTDAVKASHAECESFVGIIVERIAPAASGEVNWAVKGIRYGAASRQLCDAALSDSVAERQLRFTLSD
jgi:hypothetical protein